MTMQRESSTESSNQSGDLSNCEDLKNCSIVYSPLIHTQNALKYLTCREARDLIPMSKSAKGRAPTVEYLLPALSGPNSERLLLISSNETPMNAFKKLIDYGVQSAPVLDATTLKCSGLLDLRDLVSLVTLMEEEYQSSRATELKFSTHATNTSIANSNTLGNQQSSHVLRSQNVYPHSPQRVAAAPPRAPPSPSRMRIQNKTLHTLASTTPYSSFPAATPPIATPSLQSNNSNLSHSVSNESLNNMITNTQQTSLSTSLAAPNVTTSASQTPPHPHSHTPHALAFPPHPSMNNMSKPRYNGNLQNKPATPTIDTHVDSSTQNNLAISISTSNQLQSSQSSPKTANTTPPTSATTNASISASASNASTPSTHPPRPADPLLSGMPVNPSAYLGHLFNRMNTTRAVDHKPQDFSVTYLSVRNRCVMVNSEESLFNVISILATTQDVHRVVVTKADPDNAQKKLIVDIISQSDIVKIVYALFGKYLESHPKLYEMTDNNATPSFSTTDLELQQSIDVLHLGTAPVLSVPVDATMLTTLQLLSTHKVSGVAVVDSKNRFVGNTSGADLKLYLQAPSSAKLHMRVMDFLGEVRRSTSMPTRPHLHDITFNNADSTINDINPSVMNIRTPTVCVSPNASLLYVIAKLTATGMHRVFVVNPTTQEPVAVVSVEDIVKLLHHGYPSTRVNRNFQRNGKYTSTASSPSHSRSASPARKLSLTASSFESIQTGHGSASTTNIQLSNPVPISSMVLQHSNSLDAQNVPSDCIMYDSNPAISTSSTNSQPQTPVPTGNGVYPGVISNAHNHPHHPPHLPLSHSNSNKIETIPTTALDLLNTNSETMNRHDSSKHSVLAPIAASKLVQSYHEDPISRQNLSESSIKETDLNALSIEPSTPDDTRF